MKWFRKPAQRRPMTVEEKVASAASYLAKHAAARRKDAGKFLVRRKCAELRDGKPSPIAPREIVVASVRARREMAHG